MIGHLSGTVLKIRDKKLILNVQGVGYEVFANSKVLDQANIDSKQKLWIHTHQTSDAISLFGFTDEKDLNFFELLTSVNGVGCKTALDILESPVEALESIIFEGNATKLAETPGIGKKTAARIILELKPKITGGDIELPVDQEIDSSSIEAIVSLGYSKKEAEKGLRNLPKDISKAEEIVKWFLQNS